MDRSHEATWLEPEHLIDARDPGLARRAVERATAIVRARVRRFLSRWPRAGDEVDDLVQEIWLALLDRDARRLRSWDRDRGVPLERFIAMIADRQLASRSAHGRARRRSAQLVELDAMPEHAAMDTWTPEDAAGSAALLTRWRAHVGRQLPVRGRAIFELMIRELDPDQIATALEVNRQVVYNWQHQIRGALSAEHAAAARGDGRNKKRSRRSSPYSSVLARSG